MKFSHFFPSETSAKLCPHSGSELLPESSPSTGELMWTLMGRRWWMMSMGTRGGSRVLVGGTCLAVIVLCGGMLQGDVVTSLCDHAAAVSSSSSSSSCLRFSSSTEWWTFQLHADLGTAQCTLCRPWRSHRYSSRDGFGRARCCATTGALVGVAHCLVRRWIHVMHHPGWFLEEFLIFYEKGHARLLRSILVLDIPFMAQRLFPLGPVQKTIEILPLQYIDKVIDVCCAGPTDSWCSLREDGRHPTGATLCSSLDKVVHSSWLCNDSAVWFRRQ